MKFSIAAVIGVLSVLFVISCNNQSPPVTSVDPATIRFNQLPIEAQDTIRLIENGGPFPYSQDGTVFNNFELLLPKKPTGYYHEFTVVTPGSTDRGARRIIAGAGGEYYYTQDHYITFKLVEN